MAIEELDLKSFTSKIITEKESAVVDFYADWCGPCKMFSPVIDAVSEIYAGKVNFYKINIDKESALAAKYNVMSIPTGILYQNGEVKDSFLGALTKEKLTAFIDKNLEGN